MNMQQLTILKRALLGSHHHATLTKHTISAGKGVQGFPPFVELVIATHPDETGCYLFRVCADGQAADTWHSSVKEALDQAVWEFGIRPDEWTTSEAPEVF